MGHAERIHRDYSPSQAERFIGCPGSVSRVRSAPTPKPTADALMGTKAHEYLEAGLKLGTRDFAVIANSLGRDLSELHGTGIVSSVNVALDFIAGVYAERNAFGDAVLWSEVTVPVPNDANPGQCDGTLDASIYAPTTGELDVFDFKHGVASVEVKHNPQLKQLAVGALHDTRLVAAPDDVTVVRMHIVQPRAFHKDGPTRTWTVEPSAILKYKEELEGYVRRSMAANAVLNPGTYCKYCPAAPLCPALEHRALTAATGTHFASIKDVSVPALPDPKNIEVERLAYIKNAFGMLENWMASVDRRIDELLRDGVAVPGFKLVEAKPRRYFVGDEKKRIEGLAALIGCNTWDLYETSPKGITETEDMVVQAYRSRVAPNRKNLASEDARKAFAFFTVKESSGAISVAPESDSRPAVNLAVKHFSNIRGVLPPPNKKEE